MLKFSNKSAYQTEVLTFNQGHVFRVEYAQCSSPLRTWEFQDPGRQRLLTLEFEEATGILCSATFRAKPGVNDGVLQVSHLRINPEKDTPTRPQLTVHYPQFARYRDLTTLTITLGDRNVMLALGNVVQQAGAAEGDQASFIWAPGEYLNLVYLHHLEEQQFSDLQIALGVTQGMQDTW